MEKLDFLESMAEVKKADNTKLCNDDESWLDKVFDLSEESIQNITIDKLKQQLNQSNSLGLREGYMYGRKQIMLSIKRKVEEGSISNLTELLEYLEYLGGRTFYLTYN